MPVKADPAILFISEDDAAWVRIQTLLEGCSYPLLRASSLEQAAVTSSQIPVAVMVADAEIGPASWRDVQALEDSQSRRPKLIVVARHATEQLWLEVLDRGGVDLFSKSALGVSLRRAVEEAVVDWVGR